MLRISATSIFWGVLYVLALYFSEPLVRLITSHSAAAKLDRRPFFLFRAVQFRLDVNVYSTPLLPRFSLAWDYPLLEQWCLIPFHIHKTCILSPTSPALSQYCGARTNECLFYPLLSRSFHVTIMCTACFWHCPRSSMIKSNMLWSLVL